METLKRETRYMVRPYHDAVPVEAMVDETGCVRFFYSQEDDDWYKPFRLRFFTDREEAENYANSLIPSDMEKVKAYLEYLYEYDDDELEKCLPEGIYDAYQKGLKSSCDYSYSQMEQLKSAISGNININAVTFRKEQVSHIKWVKTEGKYKARITLTDGTKVETRDGLEYEIIKAAFNSNHSEMTYTS